MSSCHHAVKDFCMIHTNKKQGHSSAKKTGALLVIQKNAIYTSLLGKQRGQGR